MRHRRAFIPGGSFFFTVVTERRQPLLASAKAVEVLRMAMRTVRVPVPEDMNIPGLGYHSLTGNRKGQSSVSVSGNWRITFRFENGDAYDANLQDYH